MGLKHAAIFTFRFPFSYLYNSFRFLFCLHEEVRGNEKVEALFFKLPVSNFALSVLKAWVEKQ